jgi:hypothetical protein
MYVFGITHELAKKVNFGRMNKTEGKLENCKELIGGIKWAQNPVNALGIFFEHNKEEC